MSTQITVRLADDLVAFADAEVTGGTAKSRAAVVTRALERERRRVVAERDACILAESTTDDLDAVADYATHVSLDDLR